MTTKKSKLAKPLLRKALGLITFGEMLSSLRDANEMTQVEMANLLEISKQDLCNIEKGRKVVSVERAVNFAKSLKMPAKTFAKYALQDQLNRAGITGEIIIQDVA